MVSTLITSALRASIVCACAVTLANADMRRANEGWRWVRFGTESGLPSERVARVMESHNGEIWAQTSRGFAWFDEFRWYPVAIPDLEHSDAASLDFVEDSTGILVFKDGSAYHLDRDTVYRVPLVYDGRPVLVRHAWWLEGGHVFQGDSSLFRRVNGSLLRFPSPYEDSVNALGARTKDVNDGLISTRRSCWVKIGTRLFHYEGQRWITFFKSPTGLLRIHDGVENDAGYGAAVIQTKVPRQDLYVWEPGKAPRRFHTEEADLIRCLDVSPDGEVLILQNPGNLRLYHRGTIETLPPFPTPVANSLFVFFRSNGDLWVCTELGLYLCRLTSERWSLWETGEPGRQSMVNCMVRAQDGSFWFGTADGICVRSPEGRNSYIREIDGRVLGSITALAEDRQGNIWIGSGATMLGVYRWNGKTWRHFGPDEGLADPLNAAPLIHKIVVTRSGQIWFCGMGSTPDLNMQPGAFRFEDGRFHRVGRGEGLLDGRVYSVVEDRTGALWFGTLTGLSRLYRGSWSYWANRRTGTTARTLISSHQVFTLAVDSSNHVWLGQKWNGLGYVVSDDSIRYFTTEDGLVSNQVWGLEVDSLGVLWVSTWEGVGCFDGKQWMSFDVHTGFPNSLTWPILARDRRVFVGTHGSGVVVLLREHMNVRPHQIRLQPPLVEDGRVTLRWDANAHWAFVPAGQIETRYRLQGEGWSAWSTTRSVVFNGLDDGSYLFEVEPRATVFQEAPQGRTASFTIPPPLYLRPVVALPMLVLGLLVLTLAAAVWDRKRRYDRTVRESEARFRALYKSNPIPTFTWKRNDNEFMLIDVNDAAMVMSGGRLNPAMGSPIQNLMKDLPGVVTMVRQCYANQSIVRDEIAFSDAVEGAALELAVTCSYVYPDMVLTHMEDVTERKHAEARIRESREQLRALASRLETVREEERSQLSREIHDELGQLMTGLKMDLAWIRKRIVECGEQVAGHMMERIQQMNTLLDDSIQTVRKIASQLRPALLDELGLIAAMEWQVKEWQMRTGIACHAEILTDDPHFPKERAIELFRIFQELLTNVARHSGATDVIVVLNRVDNELVLEVNDNGCGIRKEKISRPVSLGILGMEERATRIGGTIVFSGEPGRGTTVRVTIPMEQVRS